MSNISGGSRRGQYDGVPHLNPVHQAGECAYRSGHDHRHRDAVHKPPVPEQGGHGKEIHHRQRRPYPSGEREPSGNGQPDSVHYDRRHGFDVRVRIQGHQGAEHPCFRRQRNSGQPGRDDRDRHGRAHGGPGRYMSAEPAHFLSFPASFSEWACVSPSVRSRKRRSHCHPRYSAVTANPMRALRFCDAPSLSYVSATDLDAFTSVMPSSSSPPFLYAVSSIICTVSYAPRFTAVLMTASAYPYRFTYSLRASSSPEGTLKSGSFFILILLDCILILIVVIPRTLVI